MSGFLATIVVLASLVDVSTQPASNIRDAAPLRGNDTKRFQSTIVDKKTGRVRISCSEEQIRQFKELDGYLPTVLRVAELNNELENLKTLRSTLQTIRHFAERGLLSHLQVDQSELDELRTQRSVLRTSAKVENALDQFKTKLNLKLATPVELDQSLVLPIHKYIQRFDRFFTSASDIYERPFHDSTIGKPIDLRIQIKQFLQSHPLVKGTHAGKKFISNWKKWESADEATLQKLIKEQRARLDAQLFQRSNPVTKPEPIPTTGHKEIKTKQPTKR